MPIRPVLGALPSPPDHRDLTPRPAPPARAALLPARLDLGYQSPIRNQANDPDCVGQAVAAILEFYLRREGRLDPGRLVSPPDLYDGGRSIERPAVPGAYPRAVLKWSQREGVCLEADRRTLASPYGPDAQRHRPATKVGVYASITPSVLDQRTALQEGPLLVVLPVTAGFYAPTEGVVHDRGSDDGYHAVVLVGYDHGREAFRLRNSWGATWGERGYAWLPYTHRITEAWSLRPALSALPPPPAPPAPRPSWWPSWLPWVS
jgi:hypothetical protein